MVCGQTLNILQPEMQVPVKIYMLIKKNRGHHAVEFSSLTRICPELYART